MIDQGHTLVGDREQVALLNGKLDTELDKCVISQLGVPGSTAGRDTWLRTLATSYVTQGKGKKKNDKTSVRNQKKKKTEGQGSRKRGLTFIAWTISS